VLADNEITDTIKKYNIIFIFMFAIFKIYPKLSKIFNKYLFLSQLITKLMIQKLNLPDFEFKYQIKDNKKFIFDEIRKKYIVLTEEEWVRQNILKYFLSYLNYPKYLLGVEKSIKVFNTIKRPDIVVYSTKLEPKMIVECKKPDVVISKDTLNQAINYYIELKPSFFLLTNGLRHYCCTIVEKELLFLNEIPKFDDLQRY